MYRCGLVEAASLLELAPLLRLRVLLFSADKKYHAAASPAFQAALAKLCCRCPSLERVTVSLHRHDDDDVFFLQYAAEHLLATLALHGRPHVVVSFCCGWPRELS